MRNLFWITGLILIGSSVYCQRERIIEEKYVPKTNLSKQLDSIIGNRLLTSSPNHKKYFRELLDSIMPGILQRIDTLNFRDAFFSHSLSAFNSSIGSEEYFFKGGEERPFKKYYKFYGTGVLFDPDSGKIELKDERKIVARKYKKIKNHQRLNYDRVQVTGTGCICYTGIRLMKIRIKRRREIRRKLRNTWQIQVRIIDRQITVSMQAPAVIPHFRLKVLCGRF
jgi:hypothetical protein